jgi:hypothetical protein
MRSLLLIAVAAGAALTGLAPTVGRAQSYTYVTPPLTTIERNQRSQLDANRAIITQQSSGRFQTQLDLEKQTYDESRRRREDYLFQGNTSQRALETQLREQDLQFRQKDQELRERNARQNQEEEQGAADARRGLTQ